jgi:hypothetical protein
MCIVTLEDGTTYNIDTDSSFNARSVVEYKLKNRMDFRKIAGVQERKGIPVSGNYNSGSAYDGKDLRCSSGWSYKWD